MINIAYALRNLAVVSWRLAWLKLRSRNGKH